MKYSKPVWELMAECAAALPDRFRFAQVQRWFDAHYPDINERTLRVHLIGLTEGPSNPNPYLAKKAPLFRRVEHGEYEVIGRGDAAVAREPVPVPPAESDARGPERILLVWCEGEQRTTPAPARDLFTSPEFVAVRRGADASDQQWFVLTSEFGALHPATVVAPYARRVRAESAGFRRAWCRWVAAKLVSELDGIESVAIDVRADGDAGELVEVLEGMGARVRVDRSPPDGSAPATTPASAPGEG